VAVWKEIRCDRNLEDCYDNRSDTPQGFDTATELRKRGKRSGWKFKDGDDICPACAKHEPPPEPPVSTCTACFRIFTRSMGACPFCAP
jgi:hypothetical protein